MKSPFVATNFSNALQQFCHFSDESLTQINTLAVRKEIEKGAVLLESGKVCEAFYFIEHGAIYQSQTDEEGTSVIIDLHSPGDWVINAQSFTSRKPSMWNIRAFEESTVIQLGIHSIHQLIAQSPVFLQLGKILSFSIERLQLFDQQATPDEKYQYVLQHRPSLLQHFPQHMIAAYLKMTPETLSRVRKRLIS